MSARFDLFCNGCGRWQTFGAHQTCECPACGTAVHLSETGPATGGDGLAAFHGPELDVPLGAVGAVLS
jgi:hypothetical protein